MSVNIRGRLPKDDRNGLTHLETTLAANPDRVVTVVAYLQTDTIEARPHDDDNPRAVKVTLLHIEAIEELDDVETATAILSAAYQTRTGKVELPLYDDDGEP